MYSSSAGGEVEGVDVLFIDERVGRGVISVEVGSVEEVSGLDLVVEGCLVDELVVDDVRRFGSMTVELGRTVEGNTLVSPFVFVDMSLSKVNVGLGL